MKGSYTATFIAYIKSSGNLWGLQNCLSWGSENYLKWLQLLVPLEQHSLIKMTFGIKCSSNLSLKKVIRIHQFHRVPYHHYVCRCKSCGTGFAFRTSMLCLKYWFSSVTWQLSPLPLMQTLHRNPYSPLPRKEASPKSAAWLGLTCYIY